MLLSSVGIYLFFTSFIGKLNVHILSYVNVLCYIYFFLHLTFTIFFLERYLYLYIYVCKNELKVKKQAALNRKKVL